jgi:hypothetical protein
MIKFLKFLWKKCFGCVGDSRIKTEVKVVKPIPAPIPTPKPTHCTVHNRFKKSCVACAEVTR